MFDANDSSMNDTCNTYVWYTAQMEMSYAINIYFQPNIGRKIRTSVRKQYSVEKKSVFLKSGYWLIHLLLTAESP